MKSVRKRQIPYEITYMWNVKYDINDINVKYDINLRNRNSFTDIENKLVVAKGDREERDWEFGINRCKLPHTE